MDEHVRHQRGGALVGHRSEWTSACSIRGGARGRCDPCDVAHRRKTAENQTTMSTPPPVDLSALPLGSLLSDCLVLGPEGDTVKLRFTRNVYLNSTNVVVDC